MLDVGTGYGYFPSRVKKTLKNIEITGLDLNHNKLNYGKNTLNFDFECMFNEIEDEKFIKENEETFDIITSWHVLEHVFDPILWTKNIIRLLKQGGIFIFEVPNEDDELIELSTNYSELIHFQDHVNYFHKINIEQLLDLCEVRKENYQISGVQRYGFYNYIDWLRHGTKDKVESDDYINLNNKPRNELENIWMKYRESNINSDTMYVVIKKN
jgi:ubiquinone/menaquinone biosynthesis C-methylase UbiE